jgi:hypothetical protein
MAAIRVFNVFTSVAWPHGASQLLLLRPRRFLLWGLSLDIHHRRSLSLFSHQKYQGNIPGCRWPIKVLGGLQLSDTQEVTQKAAVEANLQTQLLS